MFFSWVILKYLQPQQLVGWLGGLVITIFPVLLIGLPQQQQDKDCSNKINGGSGQVYASKKSKFRSGGSYADNHHSHHANKTHAAAKFAGWLSMLACHIQSLLTACALPDYKLMYRAGIVCLSYRLLQITPALVSDLWLRLQPQPDTESLNPQWVQYLCPE